jgi:biotin synthase-like enzyme
MGRPLNDRNFGNDGIKIAYKETGETAVADAVIIKQTGSKTFVCATNATSNDQEECKLVQKASGSLADKECSILLTTGVYATKITGRKVRGDDGNVYKWDLDGAEDSTQGWNLSN